MPNTHEAQHLARDLPAHDVLTGEATLAPQKSDRSRQPARDVSIGLNRVLSDGLRIGTRLIDDQHTGCVQAGRSTVS